MIQLSKVADYGMVIMAHLAGISDGAVLSSRAISEAVGVPAPTVSKILKILHKNEFLHSIQGPQGGYQLARPAHEIFVVDILAVLEKPIALTECSMPEMGMCKIEPSCSIKPHWIAINTVIKEALTKLSLSEMAAPTLSFKLAKTKENLEKLPIASKKRGEYGG